MTSQFVFRGSPPNQSTISTASSSPPTTPAGLGKSATSNGAGRSFSPAPSSTRCCDTGRPIFQDPITGQTICSCQYELLNYQRLTSGVPLSVYTAPYSEAAAATAAGMAAYFPALSTDQPPFYANSTTGIEMKENLAASAASWPYPSVYHPYDAASAAFAGYPFNGYGMDLNGARRKNATRETTSTLKAWLNEHKKNPYPTKGEKIMLAIITKMTLTQVSTWFANARRRLKKENKMTWEPRNRVDDEDNNNDDQKSMDGKDMDGKESTASSEDGDRPQQGIELLAQSSESVWSELREDCGPDSPEPCERPPHGVYQCLPSRAPIRSTSTSTKPRIWSLADMASKDGETPNRPCSASTFYHTSAAAAAAARLAHPYGNPELYQGIYSQKFSGDVGLLSVSAPAPPALSPASSSSSSFAEPTTHSSA